MYNNKHMIEMFIIRVPLSKGYLVKSLQPAPLLVHSRPAYFTPSSG